MSKTKSILWRQIKEISATCILFFCEIIFIIIMSGDFRTIIIDNGAYTTKVRHCKPFFFSVFVNLPPLVWVCRI
jgi:hypothetical protein